VAKIEARGADQPTILVVDDLPENIDVIRAVLESRYRIRVALNGKKALQIAASTPQPDLILLDVMMPVMDGYTVCRKLKARQQTASIPVIFVSAMQEIDDELQGFAAGGVDYITKPITPAILLSRVQTHLQLRAAYHFIRETFGRYLSEEVVDTIVDSPCGLAMGGEKRALTVMMADLRGFTEIAEMLPAESVVRMLNLYLGRMTEVIQAYHGTIDEFLGDGILTFFGAPLQRPDDALRAVQCAVAMQQAMVEVNAQFQAEGLPRVQMGIGLHSGQAIVGNIGSSKRAKYGAVGAVINTASRIESYTIGGQVLISETIRQTCGDALELEAPVEVWPKGLHAPLCIYAVQSVSSLQLPSVARYHWRALTVPCELEITLLHGKHLGHAHPARLLRWAEQGDSGAIELSASRTFRLFSDIKVRIQQPDSEQPSHAFYAKIIPPDHTLMDAGQPQADNHLFAQITSPRGSWFDLLQQLA